MTKQEWLTSKDPAALLESLKGRLDIPKVSDRRLRLFACACVRQTAPGLSPGVMVSVDAAEQFADGEIDAHALHVVHLEVAAMARNSSDDRASWCSLPGYAFDPELVLFINKPERAKSADILRDIVGNPFAKNPRWMRTAKGAPILVEHDRPVTWLAPTVLSLAQAAYDERGRKCPRCQGERKVWDDDPRLGIFDNYRMQCPGCNGAGTVNDGTLDPARLAILSDALKEAGCDNQEILEHLRSPGPHVRGCWVLNLILGKN